MARGLAPTFTVLSGLVVLAGGGCSRLSGLDGLEVVACPGAACDDVDPRGQPLDGGGSDGGGTTDAPADGGGGSDGDASAAGPCPGTAGPTPVRAGSFCIDSTEVTVAQYAQFLAAHGATMVASEVPGACAGKAKSHTPDDWANQQKGSTQRPVTLVDWCDAYAFCKWSGKRLCGAIGGGASQMSWAGDAAKDQYYAACSADAAKPYPYGSTRNATACNDPAVPGSSLVDVKSKPLCEGGYPGLFDMVGNAYEWIDACSADAGLSDSCYLRGGSFRFGGATYATCASYFNDYNVLRSDRYDDSGFRCCGP